MFCLKRLYLSRGGVAPSTAVARLRSARAHYLDEVGHVHWHLLNAGVVELFRVLQSSLILGSDEVNSHALPTESTTSSNPRGRRESKRGTRVRNEIS